MDIKLYMINVSMNKAVQPFLFSVIYLLIFLFCPITLLAHAQLQGCGQIDIGNPGANQQIPPQCQTSGGGNTDVVALLKTQIGKPYGWGTPVRNWPSLPHPNPPAKAPAPPSFDCSGLTGWAWYWGSNKKVTLGGDTYSQWGDKSSKYQRHIVQGDANLKSGALQNGDLLYWGSISGGPHHVGIYVDEAHTKQSGEPDSVSSCSKGDCFIDAPNTGSFVRWDRIRGFGNDFIGYIHVVQ